MQETPEIYKISNYIFLVTPAQTPKRSKKLAAQQAANNITAQQTAIQDDSLPSVVQIGGYKTMIQNCIKIPLDIIAQTISQAIMEDMSDMVQVHNGYIEIHTHDMIELIDIHKQDLLQQNGRQNYNTLYYAIHKTVQNRELWNMVKYYVERDVTEAIQQAVEKAFHTHIERQAAHHSMEEALLSAADRGLNNG